MKTSLMNWLTNHSGCETKNPLSGWIEIHDSICFVQYDHPIQKTFHQSGMSNRHNIQQSKSEECEHKKNSTESEQKRRQIQTRKRTETQQTDNIAQPGERYAS